MLPVLFTIGILLSLLLLLQNARSHGSALYLAVFFLLISLYGFIQYTLLYSESQFLIAIVFINFGSPTYLIGPVFLFYIRSVLNDDFRLKRADFLHMIPMLVYLTLTFSYLISPWSHKTEVAARMIEDFTNIRTFDEVLLYKIFPKPAVFFSRPVLALAYALWSGILIIKYLRKGLENSVFTQQRFMITWLIILFVSFFVLLVSHILTLSQSIAHHNFVVFYTLNIFQFLSGASLAVLLISPFFFPGILYGLPRIPIPSTSSNKHQSEEIITANDGQKLAIPRFEADYMRTIDAKVETYMREHQPFLLPGFNLPQLSVLTGIPVHHLAAYFRDYKLKTPTDFRNEWRIEHAKKLIAEGKAFELTIEAIGFLAGFNSRNAFLNAFKKVEKTTPADYIAKTKA